MKRPYAIVAELDNFVGLQTARLLARNGVRVIALAVDPGEHCCRTNAVEKIVPTRYDDDALMETLMSLGETLDEHAVLFPCSDFAVRPVSRHQDALRKYFRVAMPDNDTVEMLMDKSRFFEFGIRENLAIPPSVMLHNRADAERAADELTFPCVLKPGFRGVEWNRASSMKNYKVRNRSELLDVYGRFSGLADMLIASEWIEGPEDHLYSCNCYYDADSKLLCSFVARKLRQWPPETGYTSLGEEVDDERVREIALEVFSKVRYHGLGYLEIKKSSRTGRYGIIEANIGRPTGRSALAEFCGVDLVYTQYCDKAGLPLPTHRLEQKQLGGKWIDDLNDFSSALYRWRRGELTLGQWLHSLRGRKHHAIWSVRDPMPFLIQLRAFVGDTVRRRIERWLRPRNRSGKGPATA